MLFFFCIALCVNRFASALKLIPSITLVQVPGPRKWLILGVSLTRLVESKDLQIVDNIFNGKC